MQRRLFASDNYAGICPQALAAMQAANVDHAPAYGEDVWTQRLSDRLRDWFETDCEVFLVFNGTAANALALASLCRSHHAVICARLAHIETDECGAPEFFTGGTKILLADGQDGKLVPADIERMVHHRRDLHYPKPRAISLTQATELGTVYTIDELRALGAVAHGLGLSVHMDGARFANALATLNCAPKECSWQAGVDVLCLGGVKNGLAAGEAVVFFNRAAAHEFEYRCKQAGQLASKMRFLSAPWLGLLNDGVWLANARHANAMAQRLADGLRDCPGITLLYPCQANAVFVDLPAGVGEALHQRGWHFYTFIGSGGARLMCSWDTQPEDVDALLADVRAALQPDTR